jgi:PAS domain S-box-containing protein
MDKAHILVVEDESIVAFDIKHSLTSLGYAVVAIVSSGEEAVQMVTETRPDLVLVDIKLKGAMDGVEAAEQIRALSDVPVVYLTGYADEATLQRAKVTEPFGFVLKPFEPIELHTAIEMALYKHEMERRLKESEWWLAATLKSIGEAVIATDTQGYITFMNPVAEGLTGWPQEEALGKDLREVFKIVNDHTQAPDENPVTRALREGVVVSVANHTLLVDKGGTETPIDDNAAPIKDDQGNVLGAILVFSDISKRVQAENRREELIAELQGALAEVKTLTGLLPICASCKRIRDDQGYWQQVEVYIQNHSDVKFSHGICPDCTKILYPELYGDDE